MTYQYSPYTDYPETWQKIPFSDCCADATSGSSKIKREDYQRRGVLPIIDQGKEAVGGYVDDLTKQCSVELPCILFGDHTRIFKYCDKPFALGADGVKVLKPTNKFDERFLYHYLCTLILPDNAGYSRHFKYLRKTCVPLPPLPEQKRIAAILDKADAIRRKRKAALDMADEFLRATFLDMFGDPVTNPKGWDVGCIGDLLKEAKYGTAQKADPYRGEFPILRMGNITYSGWIDTTDLKYVDLSEKDKPKYLARPGDILFNRTNSKELVGKTAVFNEDKPMAIAGYLVRARVNERGNPYYISAYMNSRHGKKTLEGMCKSIVGMANINAKEFQTISIMLPPKSLQDKYEKVVQALIQKKKRLSETRREADNLFASLSQRAFRGEL